MFSKFVTIVFLGSVLSLPTGAGAEILFGAGAGVQFHDLSEREGDLSSGGDGSAVAYQVSLGLSGDMASVYGIYSGSGYILDAPPGGGERRRRMLSMAGAGLHLYLNPDEDLIPYLLGGGGVLIDAGESFTGRGPAYFGGMGLKFAAPFALEARYTGGVAEDGDRSLELNSFQLSFLLFVK